MRLPFIAVTIVALLLIACSGPEKPTLGVDPENSPIETPEYTEPSPSATPLTPTSAENTPIETPEYTESSPLATPLAPTSPENTLIETPEYTGVIVSENGASEFGYLFDQTSTSFWEPSIDDIASAEKCIRQYLVSVQQDPDAYQGEDAAFILENLEEYRRQYVGIVVDGEKRIWCNSFFSDHSFPNWQRVPVDVDGGGNHYWQIEYSLPKDECISFHVHGQS